MSYFKRIKRSVACAAPVNLKMVQSMTEWGGLSVSRAEFLLSFPLWGEGEGVRRLYSQGRLDATAVNTRTVK